MSNKEYSVSTFTCKRDSFTISGSVYRTAESNENRIPMILCHGFMANQREGKQIASVLAQNGYIVFTFDFVGGSSFSKSDGKTTDMTIFTEKEDLRCVMDYVKGCEYVDYDKLILAGCSQGGFVAGLTAAEYQEEVKQLILLYPALCIPDDARKGQMQIFRFSPDQVPDVIESHGRKLNGDYARLVMHMDAIAEVSKYQGPILLLAGKKDPVVSFDYMEQLIDTLHQNRGLDDSFECEIDFFSFTDAKHGFNKKEGQLAARRILHFLEGYKEILTIQVKITDSTFKRHGLCNISELSFEANCDTYYFKGVSLPGAKDVQKRKLMKILELKADYIMQGRDCSGADCNIHIINRDTGEGWIPAIETNSDALSFLNEQQCITLAENHKEGVVIHILARK